MLDLYNIKYDLKVLKNHIYELNFIDILKTQILDVSFIVKYIMNPKYQLCYNEKMIDIKMVLKYQKHIKEDELIDMIIEYNNDNNDNNEDNDDISLNFELYAENNT